MIAPRAASLYTPEMLALAVSLADYPLSDTFDHRATARSRACGSEVTLGLASDEAGAISGLGMAVSACAVGQAAAAIFARSALGRTGDDCATTADALRDWLTGQGDMPDWPGLDIIAAAQAHPGRHPAVLLPWRAAAEALSNAATAR